MPPLPKDRRDWIPELVLALNSIAIALAGQEPTPDRVGAGAYMFADAVLQHRVEIHWFEDGYLFDSDIDEPRNPEYALTIIGDRLLAGWLIPAAEFAELLRLVKREEMQ